MEFIIENITKKEYEILEENNINWCPDELFFDNHNIIIFDEEEYDKTIKLLNR